MSARMLPPHKHTETPSGQDWKLRIGRWWASVEGCRRKPSRRRVHAVRSETLRLQAELDLAVHSGTWSPPVLRAVRRWRRAASCVRRLLAPIRSADVCLEILGTFRGPGAVDAAAESPDARDTLRAIERLHRELRGRRAVAGRRMMDSLKARRFEIEESARGLGQALGSRREPFHRHAALRRLMLQLAAAAPGLTPAGLHPFRKLARTGRYLAESAARPGAWTRDAGLKCRSIQKAVGSWRDWSSLARLAKHTAAGGVDRILALELAEIASRLRREALAQCRQSAGEPAPMQRSAMIRRPPARVPASVVRRSA